MKRVITELVSDISGEDLGTGGNTVNFSYLGVDYEIDLSAAEWGVFSQVMTPYIEAGRRTGKTPRRSATVGGRARSDEKARNREIRVWAEQNGIQVSDRGRISADVIKKWQQAQSGQTAVTEEVAA